MNYQAAQFWANIIALIVGAGAGIHSWQTRRRMITSSRLSRVEETINEHVADNGVQLAHIDERLRNAIDLSELNPLYERLNSVDKSLSEMKGKMHTLDLIHEMLLNEGGQKK